MVVWWTLLAVLSMVSGPVDGSAELVNRDVVSPCIVADALMEVGQFDAALDRYVELLSGDLSRPCAVRGLQTYPEAKADWHLEQGNNYEQQGRPDLAGPHYVEARMALSHVATPSSAPFPTSTPYEFTTEITLNDNGFPEQAKTRIEAIVTATPSLAADLPAELRHLDEDPTNDHGVFGYLMRAADAVIAWFTAMGSVFAIVAVLMLGGWFLWPRFPWNRGDRRRRAMRTPYRS